MKTEQALHVKDFGGIETDKICYFKNKDDNKWYIYFPGIGLGNLANHNCKLNDENKLTVTPSILTRNGHRNGKARHGYLTNGVWKDV